MTAARHVLLLDDDPSLLTALQQDLRGFRVFTANHQEAAQQIIKNNLIDLCLVNYALGRTDGHAAIRDIRTRLPNVPCVFMTSSMDGEISLDSLNLGVSGFLEKPFTAEALRECLERFLPLENANSELVLDSEAHSVELEGRTILLTPIEFRILSELWNARGRLVRREDICARLWGTINVTEHTFDTHFTNMKRKIPELRNRIQVVRSQGYIFTP
jgi:DNA-binding response OmpR family regulator